MTPARGIVKGGRREKRQYYLVGQREGRRKGWGIYSGTSQGQESKAECAEKDPSRLDKEGGIAKRD